LQKFQSVYQESKRYRDQVKEARFAKIYHKSRSFKKDKKKEKNPKSKKETSLIDLINKVLELYDEAEKGDTIAKKLLKVAMNRVRDELEIKNIKE
jgi:hypothetical protein